MSLLDVRMDDESGIVWLHKSFILLLN